MGSGWVMSIHLNIHIQVALFLDIESSNLYSKKQKVNPWDGTFKGKIRILDLLHPQELCSWMQLWTKVGNLCIY